MKSVSALIFLIGFTVLFSRTLPAMASVCACYKTNGHCQTDTKSTAIDETACDTLCDPSGADKFYLEADWAAGEAGYDGEDDGGEGYRVYSACAASDADATALEVAARTSTGTSVYATPNLAVDIPGLKFTPATTYDGELQVNYIGEYVNGIYNYLVTIGLVIATVFIMVGGLQYVFGASTGNISKARARITNAVTGFVLLLFVTLILRTVNPVLTVFEEIEFKFIDEVKYIEESGDASGSTASTDVTSVGIDCPGSGDVASIARSFIGHVAYRMGGKGGAPPYPDKKTCDGVACSSFCPDDNVCLDCSGFVGKVAECAGLASKNETGGTAGIFGSAPSITSCTSNTVTTASGTITLTPGDLVGFKAGDFSKTPSFGHVWMYIGDNQIINSRGGGRAAGTAISVDKLTWACKKYPLRVVDR